MAHRALWSGRFKEPLSAIALKFSSSIDLDKRLYGEDIAGSIAHVEMLSAARILTASEARRIRSALKVIQREIESEKFELSGDFEDVHLAIEQRLIQKVGPLGGKLHTARSRNDQIALDERLYLRGAITELTRLITHLQRVFLYKAEKYFGVLMPGYTHLQRAQPVMLSHHLLAYVSMLERDRERLKDCHKRLNRSPLGAAALAGTSFPIWAQPVMLSHHLLAYVSMLERDMERLKDCHKRLNRSPLGAAALAGTSFPIDRNKVAKKLHFDGIVENSIDAVSDRDYVLEFVSACSMVMMHLSRLAEELVLWSTKEFAFVQISDAYSTGSSIMPQQKNPDIAELIRGKGGRGY